MQIDGDFGLASAEGAKAGEVVLSALGSAGSGPDLEVAGAMAGPEAPGVSEAGGGRLSLDGLGNAAAWQRDPWVPEGGTVSVNGDVWDARLAQARVHDREKRSADLAALRAVWLYEDEEDARKLVDGHGQFFCYGSPAGRADESLPCYGRDYAAAADPDFADEPMGLCERAMGMVQDEGRRRAYREEFAALARDRRDARAYYGLYGKMVRDEVRAEYARRLERVEEFKRGVKEYGEQLAVELPRVALSGGDLDAELMEKATRYGDAGRVVASLGRTRAALEELRLLQRGGRSQGAYEADVRKRADQLRREWFDSLHWRGTEVPSDEDFIQQAKADEGGSYAVDRGAIGRVVSLLRDEHGKLDGGALDLMVLALDADATGQQSIESKFLRNFGEALKSWLAETADFVNRGNARAGFIYQGPDMPAVYLSAAEQAGFREAYSEEAEKLKGALRMMEDKRLTASEKAGLLAGVMTELGTIAGDSAAGILAGAATGSVLGGFLANTAALAPAAMNRNVAQAFDEGKPNAELDGMISGFFDSAAEAGFGTALRAVPMMGRVLDKLAVTGMGSRAVAVTVSKLQGNAFARFVGDRVIGESTGELLGEEILSQSGTCLTVAALRRLGVDLDEAQWHPFSTAWENITDYRQSMATVAFCTSLGLLGLRADRHAAAQFAKRTDAMVAAGVTPQGAAKIAQLGEKTEAEIAELYRKEGAGRRTDERAQALWEEKFTAEVDDIYRREVAEVDPLVLRDRLEKERYTYLSRVEAEVSLREGVLQAALREAGVLESEQTMDGRYRLTVADKARVWEDSKAWKDGRRPEGYVEPVKVVEMSGEQLAAWAQLEMGEASLRRMKEIRSAALALDMAGRVDEGDYARMLPLTAAAAPVAAELARSQGVMNLPVLRALAEAARREGAEGTQVLPGVRNEVTAGLEGAFGQRLDVAVRMGEVSAAEAERAGAAAVRLPAVEGSSSRIVYNPGHTMARSVAEDAVEAMLAARLRRDGGVDAEGRVTPKGRVWLEGLLGEMRRVNESVKASTGRELMPGLAEAKADLQTAAEYFSHLSQSDFYLRAGDYGISEEARRHVEFMDSALMQGRMLEMFDKGFSQWVRTKEGRAWEKSGGTLAGLLREAGHELGSLYNRSRVTAENVAAVEQARAYMREPGKVSLAELEETLAQAAQEQEERDAASEVSHAVPAEESITGEEIPDDGGEAEALYTADGELVAPLGAVVMSASVEPGRNGGLGSYQASPENRKFLPGGLDLYDGYRINAFGHGEWDDLAALGAFLEGEPIRSTVGGKFVLGREKIQCLAERIGNLYRNSGNALLRIAPVGDVVLNANGVSNSIGHFMQNKRRSSIHKQMVADALPLVPDVLQYGALVEYGQQVDNPLLFSYLYAAPVLVGGKACVMVVRVRQHAGQKGKFYLHGVELLDEMRKKSRMVSRILGSGLDTGNPTRADQRDVFRVIKKALSVKRKMEESLSVKPSVPQTESPGELRVPMDESINGRSPGADANVAGAEGDVKAEAGKWMQKRLGRQGVSPVHVQGHSLGFPSTEMLAQNDRSVKPEGEKSLVPQSKSPGELRVRTDESIGDRSPGADANVAGAEGNVKAEAGEQATLSSSNAPSPFKPDLMRLLVERGFSGNTITEEDLVKPESEKYLDRRGAGLVGGRFAPLADGSVMGVARVEDVGLCPDVPQFKTKAGAAGRERANGDGTTHELNGGFRKDAPPITVWRRRDGALQVITGRHRLAHAKKNGEAFISVRVYDEDAAHDAAWAKLYDVEQNILDRQANAVDVAYFFRNTQMTEAEAEARGLIARRKDGGQTATGTVGMAVARHACDAVYTNFINGLINDRQAYFIATLGVDETGQQLALKLLMDDKKGRSLEYVKAYVLAAQKQQAASDAPQEFNLFGEDESWAREADKLARYVDGLRRQLRAQMSIMQGAGRLEKKGAAAEKLGIRVKTPADLQKALVRLALLDAALERMDSNLGLGGLAAQWDGKSTPSLGDARLMDYSAGLMASASLDIGSASLEFGGSSKRVPVIANDTTGLQSHLNDIVMSVEVGFAPERLPLEELRKPGRIDEYNKLRKKWLNDFKEFYRECLAGKMISVKGSGYRIYFSESGEAARRAVKGVRYQSRAEAGKRMEAIVENSYHLHQGKPEHKGGEGEHRRKMVDNADAFHVFGCPVSINGVRTLMWVAATHRKEESDPKNLVFYEFGVAESEKKAGEASLVQEPNSHRTDAPPVEDTLLGVLRDVKSHFEGKPKIIDMRTDDIGSASPDIGSASLVYEDAETARFSPELKREMEGIVAKAQAEGSYLLAPNGEPSKLTPVQWALVRTQAFKEWFGDWEKVATFNAGIGKLEKMDAVAGITGQEFDQTGKNDLVQRVVDYWAQQGNVAHSPMLGEVKLDARAVKDSMAHGIGRMKAAAFAAVREVIEGGAFIEHAPDWKGRGKDSYVFAAPVTINGEDCICEVIVVKDANRTGFYLHEVQVKEKLLDVFKTGLYTGTSGAPRSILLQVMGRVKDIEEKCSKIVGENGEPRMDVVREAMDKFAPERQDGGSASLDIGSASLVYEDAETARFAPELKREMEGIVAKAQAEGSYLLAPNGEPSKLTPVQWALVRTQAFKDEYGDFERIAELTFNLDNVDYEYINKALANTYGVLLNKESGISALFSKTKRNKMESAAAQRKSINNGFSVSEHNEVVSRANKVYWHATYLGEYRDYKKELDPKRKNDVNILSIRRFACPIKVKNKEAIAYLTAKETSVQGNGLYTVELTKIEMLAGTLKQLERYKRTSSASIAEDTVPHMEALFKTYFELPEKNMGENGEPRMDVVREAMDKFALERLDGGSASLDIGSASLVYEDAETARFAPELKREMEGIVAKAQAEGSYLLAPNGEPSKLAPVQWALVRTQAFKEWFGDWEKVATFNAGIGKLEKMDAVAGMTGQEFAQTGKNDLVQRVVDYWAQQGNVAHSPMLGEVKLDKAAARASIAHGMGRKKAAAFSAVKDVIESGVFIEYAPDWKGRGEDSYVFAAPVTINGEEHICEVIIMKNAKRTGFYLHEVQVKEKLLDVFKTGVDTSTSGAPKSILLQVMGRVKDIEEKCSKIVDENGEPRMDVVREAMDKFALEWQDGDSASLDGGSFSISSTLEEDVGRVLKKQLKSHAVVRLCSCPSVLLMMDEAPMDVVTEARVVYKMHKKHGLSSEQIQSVIRKLDDPLYVFRDSAGSYVFIPGITAKNAKGEEADVEVPIVLERSSHGEHYVVSAYALDNLDKVRGWLKNGKMVYDKNLKAQPSTNGVPDVTPGFRRLVVELGSGVNVLSGRDLVKYKKGNGLSYSLELGRAAEAAVQPYGKEAMMEQMVRSIRSAARVWRTTFAGRDPQEARDKAAEQMGRLMAMATGIYRVLPQGHRAGLDKLLRRGRVLAQMVESGRMLNYGRMSAKEMDALREELEDARSEFNALETVAGGYRVDGMSKAEAYREANAQLVRELGGKKLTELQAEIAEAAAGQLARYLRDREVGRMARLVEMYTPRKGKDGKLKRGKMDAVAYRELQQLVRMMNATEDVRAEEIAALQGRIAEAERVGNAALADELAAKQMAWSAFGAIAQQGLENVRKAHAQLRVLLGEGRARWEAKLEDEKARLEYEADEAVAGMGEADDTNLAKAREKERRASLWQRLKALPAYAQSIGQLFYGLGSTPGLGRLADETSRAITRGHLALATRENELQAAMAAKLEELGFKTAAQKADFVQRLRKVEDTGIVPEGEMVRRRVKMSVEDARRWVGMDKEGRDEVRKDIKKEEKRSRRKAANVPQEEDIPLMREELGKIDAGKAKGDAVRKAAYAQAAENIEPLRGIVEAAAKAAGGKAVMRPANKENGLETKAPSTAFAKAERDYNGDISRVVDLIGGTCVLKETASYADAVEAIRAALPEGCSIAKVKKLGFGGAEPCYQDVKVSIRFANGGIGEVILVSEFMNDAKFNRGGHAVYELSRVLGPHKFSNSRIDEAVDALNKLSSAIYSTEVDSAAFARAKAFASSALQGLPLEKMKALLSSRDMMVVKSSSSLLNLAKPLSVNSAAIPSSSEIEKGISDANVSEDAEHVNNEKRKNARLAESAAEVKEDRSGVDADGELRTRGLGKGRAGKWASKEGNTISLLLSTTLAKPGSEVILKEDWSDVKSADEEKKHSGRMRMMVERAFEQAAENIEPLRGIVEAAAKGVGGKAMMRPANKENGLETKAPSTAFAKAERDYDGDVSRVVDLIGGTCVLPESGSYAEAVEAIRAALPEGCSIAKVKKLGFGGAEPCYQDVKVSIRFVNGGIGEVILVSGFMNDAKFNRGGHAVYELYRVLEPLMEIAPEVNEAVKALENLSSAIYSTEVDSATFARAKALASSALQRMRPEALKASLSEEDMMVVKSSSSLLNAAKPLSVSSAAIPSFSEIKKGISNANVSEDAEHVNNEKQKYVRLAESAAEVKEDRSGVDADGELRTRGLGKGRAGKWASKEGNTISLLLSTTLAKPSSEVILKEDWSDVKSAAEEKKHSGRMRMMVERAFEQAAENIEPLRGIVEAAAKAVGGKAMMRPANKENGLETKSPSTAFAKAERDYNGDVSRVVDLIGGTCVLPESGSYAEAVDAIRAALPEGCSIAKVKKLGFGGAEPCYQDVKVSIRFVNGGIGEVILVSEFMNDAKFNRGGHAVYELSRVLKPCAIESNRAMEAYKALQLLSAKIYATGVDAEDFARAKALASSALQALQPEDMKAISSSNDMMVVKSSSSLLKAAIPLSVNSAAIPSSSEIKKGISDANVSEDAENVNNEKRKNARLAESAAEVKEDRIGVDADGELRTRGLGKGRGRKWVTVERDVRMEGKKRALRMNRDQALNLLLLCEQERYKRNAERHGYTEEVRERLREFVGEDVLEFGYWMRDWLSRSGLAEVFEAREGAPFPAEENYWPGSSFDQSGRMNENVSALDPGSGQCSSRYSMLMLRVNHDLHFDLSMGATNAFLGAVAMTNNYICMGEITAKWRRLLANRRFARSLRQRVGESTFRAIKDGLNVLDGQGVAEAYAQKAVSGIVGMFQGAHAPAVLAGSMTTLVKQLSALMHGSGCEGVDAVGLMRQLLADRVPGAGGPMTYKKMMREAVFAERHGRTQAWEDMLRLGENVTWSRLAAWSRVGMNALERMDVAANCAGMTALYNILWKRMEKRNRENGGELSQQELHERCMAEVERMMDLGAQTMRASQKSLAQAMGGGVWGRLSFYMGSEAMNKLGMFLAYGRRHGYLKAWLKYLIAMSCAEQLMCMMIDLMRGNLPEGEDESWAMWLACHVGTGISGAGLLSGVPIVGALVNHATGGYVKTASVADALGLDVWRNGKKIWKMCTGRREYSGAEWLLQLLNASRALTGAAGAAAGGVYSGIQWVSGATGLLQSVNAAGNMVRPFVPWFREDRR